MGLLVRQTNLIKDLFEKSYNGFVDVLNKRESDKKLFSLPTSFGFGALTGIQDNKVNIAQNLRLNTDWCFAVMDHRAKTIARIPWNLYYQSSRMEERVIEKHRMYDLFERVNEEYTEYDLFYLMQFGYDLNGRMPIYVQRDVFGAPIELTPIMPDMGVFQTLRNEYGKVAKYILRPGANEQKFEPDEIFMYRCINIGDSTNGIGLMNAILRVANIDRNQKDFSMKVFENQGVLSGFVSLQTKMQKQAFDDTVSKINTAISGTQNARKVLVFDDNATYEEMGLSPKEMDYLNSLPAMRDQIIQIGGVPPVCFGINNNARAEAEAQHQAYMEYTINPLLTVKDNALTQNFAQRYYPQSYGTLKVKSNHYKYEDEKLKADIGKLKTENMAELISKIIDRKIPIASARIILNQAYPNMKENMIDEMLKPCEEMLKNIDMKNNSDDDLSKVGIEKNASLALQRLYLPVNSRKPLLTADEARAIANKEGAGLVGSAPAPDETIEKIDSSNGTQQDAEDSLE